MKAERAKQTQAEVEQTNKNAMDIKEQKKKVEKDLE